MGFLLKFPWLLKMIRNYKRVAHRPFRCCQVLPRNHTFQVVGLSSQTCFDRFFSSSGRMKSVYSNFNKVGCIFFLEHYHFCAVVFPSDFFSPNKRIQQNFPPKETAPRWFKVTFLSPSWRSLKLWKGNKELPGPNSSIAGDIVPPCQVVASGSLRLWTKPVWPRGSVASMTRQAFYRHGAPDDSKLGVLFVALWLLLKIFVYGQMLKNLKICPDGILSCGSRFSRWTC